MRIERNESCPCGSGKKYKKCCLHIHQKKMALPLKKLSDKIPHFTIELKREVEDAYDHALEILEKGDLVNAKKLVSQLIQKYPKNYKILFLQGNCFIQENKIADAIDSFEKAVRIFPMFSEAIYNLASLYKLTGDLSKSIHHLKQIFRFEGELSSLGKMAKRDLEQLAEIINKNNGMTLDKYIQSEEIFQQAFGFLNEKKYDEAILHFQQSLLLNPDHVQSYGNMALAYSALGYNQKAIECLDKALSLDPEYEPAISNRQIIVELNEGERLNAQIQNVRYYQMQVEKKRKISDCLRPIKI